MPPPSPLSLGLIGYPLGHSLSPVLHHAALRSYNLSGEYRLYPIPPDHPNELAALIQRLRSGELHGLNVTIPHKQNIIPLLDELTPLARAIGAVNTIIPRNGRLVGDNTDAPGFLADLEHVAHMGSHQPRQAMVLGSGGGARAVVFALAQAGWDITIIPARKEDEAQAQALANGISRSGFSSTGQGRAKAQPTVIATPYQAPDRFITPSIRLIVNATPLGMHPNTNASPWPEAASFPPGVVVYDLVYNPAETNFLRTARVAGLTASNGLGMLVEQAALAFERWTGLPAPSAAMRAAATNV